jgi:RNA polymerase sigma-70 factor (ECF subfamily)
MDWARAACAGDREAFGHLFEAHYGRVHRTVWGMMGDEAEAHDVAQAAWIKAWQRRERFNFQSSFATWVHRIAINAALDALRRRKRLSYRLKRLLSHREDPSDPVEQIPDTRATPAQSLAQRETGKLLEAAIARLPEDQRTALVLREYEGFSYAEIAEIMHCKEGTVMSRLHLARQKVRAELEHLRS